MNIADLSDKSDSSDEDYVPGVKAEDVPSEVESDGDSEEPLSDSGEVNKSSRKRRKRTGNVRKKTKLSDDTGTVLDDCPGTSIINKKTEEEKKKKADTLWADFMKDTGFKPKTTRNSESSSNKELNKNTDVPIKTSISKKQNSNKTSEKVKITQVFEFAGEEVKVEKEVPIDSAEARLADSDASSSLPGKNARGRGRGGLKGIGSVLNQLGKKAKITTLEKSKLDWDKYKKEQKIEEELEAFKKGKDGYLEKQDFLQRTDLRTFEIEKEIRNVERNKRVNINTPM